MELSKGSDSHAISVLGAFQLSVDGCVTGLALREMRLLALLTIKGPSRREFISGTLWPETTQDRAAASLRVAVYNIRQTAPGLLDVQRCAIGLAGEVSTDLSLLQECLAAMGTPSVWATDHQLTVKILSGGELLAGWRDDWVLHERERMRHRRLRALSVLAQRYLQEDKPETALAAASAAEKLEPLGERTHLLAVQAMMMMGRVHEALEHHGQFVDRLHRELGIQPCEHFFKLGATA